MCCAKNVCIAYWAGVRMHGEQTAWQLFFSAFSRLIMRVFLFKLAKSFKIKHATRCFSINLEMQPRNIISYDDSADKFQSYNALGRGGKFSYFIYCYFFHIFCCSMQGETVLIFLRWIEMADHYILLVLSLHCFVLASGMYRSWKFSPEIRKHTHTCPYLLSSELQFAPSV